MKKGILYIATIVFYAVFIVMYKNMDGTSDSLAVTPVSSPVLIRTSMMDGGTPMMNAPMMRQGQYRDGLYIGDSAYAYYGNVHIKAIISNGRIIDVQFLDYPQDQGNSRMINTYAMPLLIQEAIQVQKGDVDVVSGATFTSKAFIQSLTSALTQAKN